MPNTERIPATESLTEARLPWHRPELQRLVVHVATGIGQLSEPDLKTTDALN
jgi:hypothetical protein